MDTQPLSTLLSMFKLHEKHNIIDTYCQDEIMYHPPDPFVTNRDWAQCPVLGSVQVLYKQVFPNSAPPP